MNLEEFHQKYAGVSAHTKIKIRCDHCGDEFEVLKTRAQQTIAQRGMYLDRSCGQKLKHASKPVTQTTKNRIGKGVHEARFKKLISDIETHVGMERVLDWELDMEENWKSGVLWTLEKMSSGEIVIIANYFDWLPKGKVWCFKEIDELEGPIAASCPLRFLKRVPVVNEVWRGWVMEFHEANPGFKPKLPKILSKWLKTTAEDY
jgi:hypothetical protein